MNSSTSISETLWRRLLCRYAVWTLLLGGLLAAAVLALDPYDTGRFALFPAVGVPHFGQRLADASLGRQPQFDTAIIGNSTIQLIDPSKLGGVHAVSLAIPGTGPREQLAVAGWFLRHHAGNARALVIGIDNRWCEANHALDLTHPFPFWLYSANAAEYARNMLQFQSLESATRKIKLMRGKAEPLRADGYNDYDAGRTWDRAGFLSRLDTPTEEGEAAPPALPPYDFAAAPLLANFLASLPPDTDVVLVVPPQYRPTFKGDAGQQQHTCEKTFAGIAAQRPHTHFVNFLARGDLTAKDEDYWDRLHYRPRVARAMEQAIGDVLEQDRLPKPD